MKPRYRKRVIYEMQRNKRPMLLIQIVLDKAYCSAWTKVFKSYLSAYEIVARRTLQTMIDFGIRNPKFQSDLDVEFRKQLNTVKES